MDSSRVLDKNSGSILLTLILLEPMHLCCWLKLDSNPLLLRIKENFPDSKLDLSIESSDENRKNLEHSLL
jgi:hypothetical protein